VLPGEPESIAEVVQDHACAPEEERAAIGVRQHGEEGDRDIVVDVAICLETGPAVPVALVHAEAVRVDGRAFLGRRGDTALDRSSAGRHAREHFHLARR
jgi:hypothetical protein